MELQEVFNQWAQSEFSDDKLEELKSQYGDLDELESAKRIISEVGQWKPKMSGNEELWESIEEKILIQRKPVGLFWENKIWLRLAAGISLILVALVAYKVIWPYEVHKSGMAEHKEYTFPDGSIAYLNASSQIKFISDDWSIERNVVMKGEVFFEVMEGEQFKVVTENGEVSVLGTSFNVKSRGSRLLVHCKSGEVRVSSNVVDRKLTAHEYIIIGSEKMVDHGILESVQADSWRTGHFTFIQAHPRDVFDEIERQFDYKIRTNGLDFSTLLYNGFFDNDDLDQAMKNVCIPLGLSYTIDQENRNIEVAKQ